MPRLLTLVDGTAAGQTSFDENKKSEPKKKKHGQKKNTRNREKCS